MTIENYQPPVKWTISVSQPGANLGTGFVQAEGCDSVTNCIGPPESGQVELTTTRISPGFYTLAAGGTSGPSELYAIITTDRFESQDLTSTTDGDLGGRFLSWFSTSSSLRGGHSPEALQTDTVFPGLQISATAVELDPDICTDIESCASVDIETLGDVTTLNGEVIANEEVKVRAWNFSW